MSLRRKRLCHTCATIHAGTPAGTKPAHCLAQSRIRRRMKYAVIVEQRHRIQRGHQSAGAGIGHIAHGMLKTGYDLLHRSRRISAGPIRPIVLPTGIIGNKAGTRLTQLFQHLRRTLRIHILDYHLFHSQLTLLAIEQRPPLDSYRRRH